jgi:hypothetical protein
MATPDACTAQKRCAIYTRRSIEQSPGHQFSSVEAQRAICSSYVASQRPNGWTELSKHYDDEGKSGGKTNKHLIALLDKARVAQAALDDRSISTVVELAAKVHCHPKKFTRLARLNYLAPDIIAAIRDGTQPPALTCRTLMAAKLPMDWALQRRLLGFPDQPDFLRAAPGW